MRRARFKVEGRIDGAPSATVTITEGGGHTLISVRPLRRRRAYEVDLLAVAQGIVFDVVKKETGVSIPKRRAR